MQQTTIGPFGNVMSPKQKLKFNEALLRQCEYLALKLWFENEFNLSQICLQSEHIILQLSLLKMVHPQNRDWVVKC